MTVFTIQQQICDKFNKPRCCGETLAGECLSTYYVWDMHLPVRQSIEPTHLCCPGIMTLSS